MIAELNRLLNAAFDLLMRWFVMPSPWPGLIIASLLTAAVLVGLFALTSNPAGILRARNRFLARSLELLLFQHNLVVTLTACGRLLRENAAYLLQFRWPIATSIVPLVLIFVQMEAWFDRRPLRPGETAIVTVAVESDQPVMTTPVALELPATARVDAPPVRTPARNEIAWRIVAESQGDAPLIVSINEQRVSKDLVVGENLARVSPRRTSNGFLSELLAPSEPSLTSPIRRIEVSYPPRELTIGSVEIHWIVAAVVLMMAFGLILGGVFGVRIA